MIGGDPGDPEGGRNAAFFFFLLAVAVLGFGGSLQPPLAVLRVFGFCAAILFLWNRRKENIRVSPYPILVGGLLVLALGHSFSSVYFWVSAQHALNLCVAAIVLAGACLRFRRNPERSWEAAFLALAAIAAVEILVVLYQRIAQGDPRPHGTFDNPNFLAEFLTGVAILSLSGVLGAGWSLPRRLAAGAGAAVLLAAALSLSRSRGVLVAAVPAFGVLLVWRFGLRKGGALLAACVLPALALLGYGAAARFFEGDVYGYGRWIIWTSAVRTFLAHPFGVGLGGYKYFWYASQSPVDAAFRRFGKFAHTAHSEYLEILSGLGVAGFLLFLAVLAVPLVLAVRGRKRIAEGSQWAAAGSACVLVLSGAHAAFDSNFHELGIVVPNAVLLGHLLAVLPDRPGWTFDLPRRASWAGVALCASALAASLATFAGVLSFEVGQDRMRKGNLAGAESAFLAAAAADPFRAVYPDAVAAVLHRRFAKEREASGYSPRAATYLEDSIRWEDRASRLCPRDYRYPMRLSSLFIDRFNGRKEGSDIRMALGLLNETLRLNPFSVEVLWRRSTLFAEIGRRERAANDLMLAVSVEPNFCRGYSRLSEMEAESADPRKAAEWRAKADLCRKNAGAYQLADFEKWLVEDPGER